MKVFLVAPPGYDTFKYIEVQLEYEAHGKHIVYDSSRLCNTLPYEATEEEYIKLFSCVMDMCDYVCFLGEYKNDHELMELYKHAKETDITIIERK